MVLRLGTITSPRGMDVRREEEEEEEVDQINYGWGAVTKKVWFDYFFHSKRAGSVSGTVRQSTKERS